MLRRGVLTLAHGWVWLAAWGLLAAACAQTTYTEHHEAAVCRDGEVCSFMCEGHECEHVCDRGSDCQSFCAGGTCVQTCHAGATCEFHCAGGHCDQTCDDGADCAASCEGGACQHHCLGPGCEMTCEDVCPCVGAGCGEQKALPRTWETDLSELTERVVAGQEMERQDAEAFMGGGEVMIDGEVVLLHDIDDNPCPDALLSCDVHDAEELGVGPAALVADFEVLRQDVRSQGSRATCVAHAVNAAVELLAARDSRTLDLSEQATYWVGHDLERNWDGVGLHASRVVSGLVMAERALHAEAVWPYNPDLACADYRVQNPDATCSESETQGEGKGGCFLPAELEEDGEVRIEAYRTVYASLGRLKLALYQGHPVVLGINVTLDMVHATRHAGVATEVLGASGCDDGPCGHAVLAVGYADDARVDGGGYVIIKNSWGARWGDGGMGYLTYDYLEREFLDATAVIAVD